MPLLVRLVLFSLLGLSCINHATGTCSISFLHIVQETRFVSDSGNYEGYKHELIICVYQRLVTNDYLKQGATFSTCIVSFKYFF